MKSYMWKTGIYALSLSALAVVSSAAPLQRADVMAEPGWVVHLDCDGLRPTSIGKFVLSELDKPEAKTKLAAFQTIFNLDVRSQLHGITLYGVGKNPDLGVAVVYADFEAERLLTLAKAAKDYQGIEHGKETIHCWTDDKQMGSGNGSRRIYAAIHGQKIIFGKNEEPVEKALDVLTGTGAKLGSSQFPELGHGDSGRFIEAAIRKLDMPNNDPSAAMLKMSKNAQLTIGEKDGQLRAVLSLVAESADAAGNMVSLAQGLLSLVKLQNEKPEALKLANAVMISHDGANVQAKITLPSSDILDMVQAEVARKEAKKSSNQ